jgi:two-component system cell cycle response regulator DivK
MGRRTCDLKSRSRLSQLSGTISAKPPTGVRVISIFVAVIVDATRVMRRPVFAMTSANPDRLTERHELVYRPGVRFPTAAFKGIPDYADKHLMSEVRARILLVEDNEMNRDMLSRRLTRKGYTVAMALDGAEGLQMAADTHPDLILLDMSLPVMDGWEAARRLKANPEVSGIPIIALTAHAMSDDRSRAIEAGCDEYDTKPIEFTRLLLKMETLLRKPQDICETV